MKNILLVLAAACSTATGSPQPDVRAVDTVVDGRTIHYLTAGSGSPVLLLHGYTETSHMWLPAIAALRAGHTVIAPDLPGLGGSSAPASYDKASLARELHGLVVQLGYPRIQVVGHDLGMMVAYAYAAQYPTEVQTLTLIEAALPGIGGWQQTLLRPEKWHFRFYGPTPNNLVAGRERTYFERFWNEFAADPRKSVPEADRALYAAAYANPGGMARGFEYFRAFDRDAPDFEQFAQTKLAMSVLVLAGEKAAGHTLFDQASFVATDVHGAVIPGVGHWLLEEAPAATLALLVPFLDGKTPDPSENPLPVPSGEQVRLTTEEIAALPRGGAGPGTSGIDGIHMINLMGDSTHAGQYSVELYVPAHTTIPAHLHPDQRAATVVSGTWYFGYGDHFDATKLKALPPGSYYTEPANQLHFAQTRDTPVIVHITGDGPTGTRYLR